MAIGLKLFKGIAFTKALDNEEIILPDVFLCLPCNPLYFAYFHFFFICFSEFLVRIDHFNLIFVLILHIGNGLRRN